MFLSRRPASPERCLHVLRHHASGRDRTTEGQAMITRTFAVLLSLAAVAFAEAKNPLKPPGEPAGPLTLVRDGQPQYTIVVRDDGTPQERKAQQDLNHWLKEITGADMARSGGPVIRIVTDEKLAPDGYRIGVEGKDLLLAGGPGRGVVNAVYALLEEDL